jgi:riboflavin synthase alpha subunit
VIPQTFALTNLQYRANGDSVNLEFDILAKYVEGMIKSVH